MLQRLGLALLLGLLVGLQRERASSRRIAGFRTFALITALGALCGALVAPVGGWIVAAGLLGVTALIVVGNRALETQRRVGPSVTTEVAMLLMFCVGAALMLGPPAIGVCLGGATAILLHLKPQLHSFAKRLDDRETRAIMQFALVSAVILPALPNVAYDAYGALNPRHVWLMVTLITGMSLAGYLAFRLVGAHAGALLAGALGGLISSTATAASFSRLAHARGGGAAALSGVVVGIACAIMYARVLIEIAAVAPTLLRHAAPALGAMGGVTALGSIALWLRARREPAAPAQAHSNPAELKSALIFGASYAVIAFVAAWAGAKFGENALYAVSVLSGGTEMDAITLSISRLVAGGTVEASAGWRFVVVAAMANTVVKWGICVALGGWALAARLAPALGGSLLVGAGALVFF